MDIMELEAGTQIENHLYYSERFEEFFRASEITDLMFQRIYGKSFKENCIIKINDLRYIKVLHRIYKGKSCVGEMIVHKDIANDCLEIFRGLYESGYLIEKMHLIDNYDGDDNCSMADNNTSAFNFRMIEGTTKLSSHSLGCAVDINPLYNPYVLFPDGGCVWYPIEAKPYLDRSKDFPYKIEENDLCCSLFKSHGFTWGGDWCDRKDYQHFEKKLT